MASFLRHVTSMQSPNNPSYVDTRIRPVPDIRDLRREANLENVAARQRYLEKLQFEMNSLRSWSNTTQDQIMGEAQQVHLQMMRMIRELQRESDPQPWAPGWASASSLRPSLHLDQCNHAAQPSSLPIKAAPTPRVPSQRASSFEYGQRAKERTVP